MSMLVFSSIGVLIISALISWAGTNVKSARSARNEELALQIAESGINYYRWHLAHAPTDYQDGTATSGPYSHVYYDKDGEVIGKFHLTIAPPPVGSTIVTVTSEGVLVAASSSRKIKAQMAIPSLAKYAIVGNSDIRFGEGTEVYGPIHSNGGIRFDGVAYNVVTSAESNYSDPDHTGNNEFGVHTHVNPPPGSGVTSSFRAAEAPPSTIPSRLDVFKAGRQFPVAPVDFTGITSDLASIKSLAQSAGRYIAPSGKSGYRLVFKTNDTFDVYKVNSVTSVSSSCRNESNPSSDPTWGSWTVNTQSFFANYPNPANGVIFVEDNVWAAGQIDTARITVVAAKFPVPGTLPVITINENVSYTNYDGSDVLALIAQGDINVGLGSLNSLKIDGALISQNGRVGRPYYDSACGSNYVRNSISLYGMLGSSDRYGFAYTDGTGYQTRTISYDSNMLYAPPPSFPLTSDQYEIISWEEID